MKEITLIVTPVRKGDTGRGIARISEKYRDQIGVKDGDLIEIIGKRRTVAVAFRGYKEDKGKDTMRIDHIIRKNAGLALAERGLVRRVEGEEAHIVVLAPVDMRLNVDQDFVNFVQKRMIDRAFCEGDLTGVTMLNHFIPFSVVRTTPQGVPVLMTYDTELSIMNEPFPLAEQVREKHVDIKYLLRIDWLNHLSARIHANRFVFSIPEHEIINSDEQKVIDTARKIVDRTLKSLRVDVTFHSNENTIGTLPWAEVDPYGRVSAIYPDVQLPPLNPAFAPQIDGERIIPPMKRCFKTGVKNCPKKIDFSPRSVVVAMPFKDEYRDAYTFAIRPALEKSGFKTWKADEQISNIDIMCKICHAIQESGYVLANITDWNPNVVFELGLAYGLAKNVILIKHKKAEVPVDLKGLEYLEYGTLDELKKNLLVFLKGTKARQ